MPNETENLLFKEKQTKILLALSDKSQEWHLENLAKAADSTYVHASRFISRCEAMGIVVTEKHGRIKSLQLTEKGAEIAKNISSIMEKLNAKQEQVGKPPA